MSIVSNLLSDAPESGVILLERGLYRQALKAAKPPSLFSNDSIIKRGKELYLNAAGREIRIYSTSLND